MHEFLECQYVIENFAENTLSKHSMVVLHPGSLEATVEFIHQTPSLKGLRNYILALKSSSPRSFVTAGVLQAVLSRLVKPPSVPNSIQDVAETLQSILPLDSLNKHDWTSVFLQISSDLSGGSFTGSFMSLPKLMETVLEHYSTFMHVLCQWGTADGNWKVPAFLSLKSLIVGFSRSNFFEKTTGQYQDCECNEFAFWVLRLLVAHLTAKYWKSSEVAELVSVDGWFLQHLATISKANIESDLKSKLNSSCFDRDESCAQSCRLARQDCLWIDFVTDVKDFLLPQIQLSKFSFPQNDELMDPGVRQSLENTFSLLQEAWICSTDSVFPSHAQSSSSNSSAQFGCANYSNAPRLKLLSCGPTHSCLSALPLALTQSFSPHSPYLPSSGLFVDMIHVELICVYDMLVPLLDNQKSTFTCNAMSVDNSAFAPDALTLMEVGMGIPNLVNCTVVVAYLLVFAGVNSHPPYNLLQELYESLLKTLIHSLAMSSGSPALLSFFFNLCVTIFPFFIFPTKRRHGAKTSIGVNVLSCLQTTIQVATSLEPLLSVPASVLFTEALLFLLSNQLGPSLFTSSLVPWLAHGDSAQLEYDGCSHHPTICDTSAADTLLSFLSHIGAAQDCLKAAFGVKASRLCPRPTELRPFRRHREMGTGWMNTGNTCFLAAWVQCFFLTSPLIQTLTLGLPFFHRKNQNQDVCDDPNGYRHRQRHLSNGSVTSFVRSPDSKLYAYPVACLRPGVSMRCTGGLDLARSGSVELLVSRSEQDFVNSSFPGATDFWWETLRCLMFAHLSDRRSLDLRSISQLCPLGRGNQEDVFELLQWTINMLNTICSENNTGELSQNREESVQPSTQSIGSLFRTCQSNAVSCAVCGRVRSINEECFALMLSIPIGNNYNATPVPCANSIPNDASSKNDDTGLSGYYGREYPPAKNSPQIRHAGDLSPPASALDSRSPHIARQGSASCRSHINSSTSERPFLSSSSPPFLTMVPPTLAVMEDRRRIPSAASSVYDVISETSSATTRGSSFTEPSTVYPSSVADSEERDRIADLRIETGSVETMRSNSRDRQQARDRQQRESPDHEIIDSARDDDTDTTGSVFSWPEPLEGPQEKPDEFLNILNSRDIIKKQNEYSKYDSISLTSLLDNYLNIEHLPDYKCDAQDGCGTMGQSSKITLLRSLPPVLLLVLNRFRHNGRSAKIRRRVIIDKFIGLPSFSPRSFPQECGTPQDFLEDQRTDGLEQNLIKDFGCSIPDRIRRLTSTGDDPTFAEKSYSGLKLISTLDPDKNGDGRKRKRASSLPLADTSEAVQIFSDEDCGANVGLASTEILDKKFNVYELYAVVIHSGESISSGHYTVAGKPFGFPAGPEISGSCVSHNPESLLRDGDRSAMAGSPGSRSRGQRANQSNTAESDFWFLFDDDSVRPFDFSTLEIGDDNIDTPYVLFYKKTGETQTSLSSSISTRTLLLDNMNHSTVRDGPEAVRQTSPPAASVLGPPKPTSGLQNDTGKLQISSSSVVSSAVDSNCTPCIGACRNSNRIDSLSNRQWTVGGCNLESVMSQIGKNESFAEGGTVASSDDNDDGSSSTCHLTTATDTERNFGSGSLGTFSAAVHSPEPQVPKRQRQSQRPVRSPTHRNRMPVKQSFSRGAAHEKGTGMNLRRALTEGGRSGCVVDEPGDAVEIGGPFRRSRSTASSRSLERKEKVHGDRDTNKNRHEDDSGRFVNEDVRELHYQSHQLDCYENLLLTPPPGSNNGIMQIQINEDKNVNRMNEALISSAFATSSGSFEIGDEVISKCFKLNKSYSLPGADEDEDQFPITESNLPKISQSHFQVHLNELPQSNSLLNDFSQDSKHIYSNTNNQMSNSYSATDYLSPISSTACPLDSSAGSYQSVWFPFQFYLESAYDNLCFFMNQKGLVPAITGRP